MLNIISIPAATAAVGYDLLTNRPDIANAAQNRVLRAIGLTGSAAAGDTAVEFKVGNRTVGTLYNSDTGFPKNDADKFPTSFSVPRGSPLSVIVTDAPATNPINVLVDV